VSHLRELREESDRIVVAGSKQQGNQSVSEAGSPLGRNAIEPPFAALVDESELNVKDSVGSDVLSAVRALLHVAFRLVVRGVGDRPLFEVAAKLPPPPELTDERAERQHRDDEDNEAEDGERRPPRVNDARARWRADVLHWNLVRDPADWLVGPTGALEGDAVDHEAVVDAKHGTSRVSVSTVARWLRPVTTPFTRVGEARANKGPLISVLLSTNHTTGVMINRTTSIDLTGGRKASCQRTADETTRGADWRWVASTSRR